MLLGCIGDDFTGSSDLANTLAREGMAVVQYCGTPGTVADARVEAGVVALKTRTVPVAEAVDRSLKALDWLLAQGCRQILFKYCSTFDSTPEGNIGPVIDALMERLETDRTIACPAFPTAGRRLFEGHLFVADRLLSESGMENHPLTPMSDADIRRWLRPQTKKGVGHVAAELVFEGPSAIADAIEAEVAAGRPVIVVDAVRDADLRAIGQAAASMRLVTGGSGIALGLPANFPRRADPANGRPPWSGAGPHARAAVLSGSCSTMTRAQVRRHAEHHAAFEVTPDALMEGSATPDAMAAQILANGDPLPLVYTSADPSLVKAAQARYGTPKIAHCVESFFARLALLLVAGGVRRLVVAGGETSGAVVTGLGLTALSIGPEIAPGVPALEASDRPLWLTLKSGNFGGPDFFEEAVRILAGDAHAR